MERATVATVLGNVLKGLEASAATGWSSLVTEKKIPLRSTASLPLKSI